MDKLFLRGLKVAAIIGVFPWERTTPQNVIVDLEMSINLRHAAQQDHLQGAVDYDVVAQRLTELIANSQCKLLETLAEKITECLRTEFQVSWLRLSLTKPGAIKNCENVGVMVERNYEVLQEV